MRVTKKYLNDLTYKVIGSANVNYVSYVSYVVHWSFIRDPEKRFWTT